MKQPKRVEFYRYRIPINEATNSGTEEEGSVTYLQLVFMSARPRQRHVIMKKAIKHHFPDMTRCQILHAIRAMGFDDLNLCKSLHRPN